MTKGLSLEEGTTVYIPAVREKTDNDDGFSVTFRLQGGRIFCIKDDDFLTEEELKAKFNEGSSEKLPNQGEMIDVRDKGSHWCNDWKFVCMYKRLVLTIKDGEFGTWDEWRYPPQKIELTLAEVEEKLGMEKGSLIIK